MFQVKRIELREIGLSLKEPFRISSGSVTHRRGSIGMRGRQRGICGLGANVSPGKDPIILRKRWIFVGK